MKSRRLATMLNSGSLTFDPWVGLTLYYIRTMGKWNIRVATASLRQISPAILIHLSCPNYKTQDEALIYTQKRKEVTLNEKQIHSSRKSNKLLQEKQREKINTEFGATGNEVSIINFTELLQPMIKSLPQHQASSS